jgi:hypothetical protein
VIASNFRRFAEALALQLPLPWGHRLRWNGSRPTTQQGRAMRAIRNKLATLVGRIVYPAKREYCRPTQDWRVTVQLHLFRQAWEDDADAAAEALEWRAAMRQWEQAGQLSLSLH